MSDWTQSRAREYLVRAYLEAIGHRGDSAHDLDERVTGRMNDPQGAAAVVNFLLAASRIVGGQIVDEQGEAKTPELVEAYGCTEEQIFDNIVGVTGAADFLGIHYEKNIFPDF